MSVAQGFRGKILIQWAIDPEMNLLTMTVVSFIEL